MEKPKLKDYCNVHYDGRKCVAQVTEVNEDTFIAVTTFKAMIENIPFVKFDLNKTYAFETAARPLMKYLAENHHPHTTVIVTSTNAEMFEGLMSTGEILDYSKEISQSI